MRAHRYHAPQSTIARTCGIEFRLIGRSIIKSCHHPLGPSMKKKKIFNEKEIVCSTTNNENDDDYDDDAFSSTTLLFPSEKIDGHALAQKDSLTPAFRKFFSLSRGRAPLRPSSNPLFFFFLTRASRHSCSPSHFPFDSHKSQARARRCIRRCCSRNFLGLQPCVLNVYVYT